MRSDLSLRGAASSRCSRPSERQRLRVEGAVQGVGFRPFVYRLARELGLGGWVQNSPQGVRIEIEGAPGALQRFRERLQHECPAPAAVTRCRTEVVDLQGPSDFEIRESAAGGKKIAVVLPDIATCAACHSEIFDRANRRYLYPFTNCTHCGPRYSIITALPYDRSRTTMRAFTMCPACQREYEDPADRRFHAQPNACPECGPQLQLWDPRGRVLASRHQALLTAVEALAAGRIVAVKGLGGFHLMVDAGSAEAVARLRHRKHRDAKPLAVMFPALEDVQRACTVSAGERELLCSPQAPIVLLRILDGAAGIALDVAPGNPCLGVLLPYTPLHLILTRQFGAALVATSGNLSDEPICIDEHVALRRLGRIADLLLVHDRPIHRHVDDSVARVLLDGVTLLRRARGYAPAPLPLPSDGPDVLAFGGHLKNTVAIAVGKQVILSQHIGDLDTAEAVAAFRSTLDTLTELYESKPDTAACDLHPDYVSTRFAQGSGLPVERLQHHHAHVAACMAEHGLEGTVLGISWDGTGFGLDGTVWGGEVLLATLTQAHRVARLRPFRLPGGDQAVVEPRRAALGVLFEIFGAALAGHRDLAAVAAFQPLELDVLLRMLGRGLRSPLTSSAGRLFDAVAALVGLRQRVAHEGQAAMQLEFAVPAGPLEDPYPWHCREAGSADGPLELDWEPMVRAIMTEVRAAHPIGSIAARFHATLIDMIVGTARRFGQPRVVLSGGCFQNAVLLAGAARALRANDFDPVWPQLHPANDGGIALGQVAIVRARRQNNEDTARGVGP